MKFFFHYHKAMSKKYGRNKLSIHYQNKCCLVSRIVCKVPISTKNNKQQPRCVLTGKANNIKIINNIAYIS